MISNATRDTLDLVLRQRLGLTFAGGYIIATPHAPDWRLWLIALATAAGVLRTRVNPLWLLAGGAVLGGLLL